MVVWLLLIAAIVLAYFFQRRKLTWLPPSSSAMLLGVAAGVFTRVAGLSQPLRFSPAAFFYALLPPIVFDAGFTLKKKQVGSGCVWVRWGWRPVGRARDACVPHAHTPPPVVPTSSSKTLAPSSRLRCWARSSPRCALGWAPTLSCWWAWCGAATWPARRL